MSSDESLPVELARIVSEEARSRILSVPLPPGRIINTDEGDGRPAVWMTVASVPPSLWAEVHADHSRSGLWPLLLGSLRDDAEFRPWESGELDLERITPPDLHDPATLLADWWRQYTEVDPETDPPYRVAETLAVTAPYGQSWPGLAPEKPLPAEPDVRAREYAAHLIAADPSMRLGLVAAGRGADALAAAGWQGPLNYTNDTGEIAAVVRSWEDRYGVRVVGAGFSDLYLSVAAPPTTLDEALHIAAEHFALCPDNIWQGHHPHTLSAYADRLVGLTSWEFWWD